MIQIRDGGQAYVRAGGWADVRDGGLAEVHPGGLAVLLGPNAEASGRGYAVRAEVLEHPRYVVARWGDPRTCAAWLAYGCEVRAVDEWTEDEQADACEGYEEPDEREPLARAVRWAREADDEQ